MRTALHRSIALTTILVTVSLVHAQTTAPTTTPTYPPVPQYAVTYRLPQSEDIKSTLQHLHSHLDQVLVTRIIDPQSGQEITDLSKPNPAAILDRGPEGKFLPSSYPCGVIYSGMLYATEVTGDQRYADFVAERFQYFADALPLVSKWDVPRNPLWNFTRPDSLDACGAIGASMVRAKRMNVGPDLKSVIDRWTTYVHKEQFRLSDGTLARNRPQPNSLWADDMYMSVPLLAQMGKLTGDNSYFDDAVKQIVQMSSKLFVPEIGLFQHGWNEKVGDNHPRYYWGRANGWCMVAMVELLDLLPEDHPGRSEVIKLLQAHARGVAEIQSGQGLWHQMLDKSDSYLESSCTAMFTYAIAKAVNHGWLEPAAYAPVAVAGWNGLITKITPDGRLLDTCIGTSYADDMIYYYHRPATDDPHGYGAALLAGAEMIRLVDSGIVRPSPNRGGPIMVPNAYQAR